MRQVPDDGAGSPSARAERPTPSAVLGKSPELMAQSGSGSGLKAMISALIRVFDNRV